MPSSIIRSWCRQLESGEDGKIVLKEMRAHYATECSLRSAISELRRHYLETSKRMHPSYVDGLKKLKRTHDSMKADSDCAKKISKFIGEDARGHRYLLRKHASREFCTGSADIDKILAGMRVLPDNVGAVRIGLEASQRCEASQTEARIAKNENVVIVKDGAQLMKSMEAILNDAHSHNLPHVILALCSVSGRRFTEICSPRTSFKSVPHTEYGAAFTGQLKTKNGATYEIPLLVRFTLFASALSTLREAQGPELRKMSNKDIATRYQGNASRLLDWLVPELTHPHQLRACYASISSQVFDFKHPTMKGRTPTFNRIAMQILGHASLAQSLAYNSVQVKGLKGRSLGEFPLSSISAR